MEPPGAQWHYCGVHDCAVVYFDTDGRTIEKSELKVRVGEKEADPPHTVCYCFGHTREDIEEEIARSGETKIPASIKAKVQARECSCEVMNPKGTCCLGDVGHEVKRAMQAAAPARDDAPQPNGEQCDATGGQPGTSSCATSLGNEGELANDAPTQTTAAALGLSALTAIGASACCWLPLLLVALGASSVGVAATFEGLRPYLLVLAPILLGFSFYMLYMRRSPCADDAACRTQRGSGGRTAKVVFWIAASLLVVSMAFPSAMASLLGGSTPARAERLATLPSLRLTVTGMTCASCSASVRSALLEIAGVVDASADHDAGVATVWYEPGRVPEKAIMRDAIKRHGFAVQAMQEHEPTSNP